MRHDEDDVCVLQTGREMRDDGVGILELLRTLAVRSEIVYQLPQIQSSFLRVPVRTVEGRENYLVRVAKSSHVILLKFMALRRVAARLVYRDDSPALVLLSDRVDRLANRRRMMREIDRKSVV